MSNLGAFPSPPATPWQKPTNRSPSPPQPVLFDHFSPQQPCYLFQLNQPTPFMPMTYMASWRSSDSSSWPLKPLVPSPCLPLPPHPTFLLPYHIPMQGPCFYPACWAVSAPAPSKLPVGFFPAFRPQFRSLSSSVWSDLGQICACDPHHSCMAKLLLTDSSTQSGGSLRSETHLFSSLLYPQEH